ncbi:MAG: hypothetical protein HZA92_16910 [Verrucomicrobia bacterium]|nr:hypothetical protein [Verrucomicrobiota bacterium]
MKRATQLGLFLAVLCCAAVNARADALGDYKVILDRNPFNLKPPPPPPPAPTNTTPETPTNYKLSGITALFNPPRAMFVNQIPGKPTPEYLTLSEGQRQGSLEVLMGGINLKDGAVRVKISGEERTLSFDKDGLKAPTGQPVMTAPGVPPPPFGLNPTQPTPGGSMIPPPNFPVQQYNRPSTAAPSAAPAATPPDTIQFQGAPSRQLRTIPINTSQQNQTSPPPAPKVDPVEQAVRIELNRVIEAPRVQRGDLPPLPPTDLTGR